MKTQERTRDIRPDAGTEAGFTLSEVVVGVAVMAILFVVVFSLYDSLQKSFKVNENVTTQQQNTRVAFDRMVADIRMAGFNYNPDGDTGRPDEQIEGMWDSAVTVRGDYDFEDSTDSTNPESTLGGSGMTYRIVSTGNDEIITYALGKPDGSGGTNVSFVADVTGVPRDGTQESVTIGNVHLTHNAPPYTLYRYIVSPNSTNVVKQPVADNIKSLDFVYYDAAGTVLSSIGGAEDPNSIEQRKRINRISIKVTGMTEDPDLAYIDPSDSNAATQHYRKFELETDVTPRNIGYVGRIDLDLDDPNAPLNFTACQGHCEGTYLKWDAPGDSDVSSYTISWGTSSTSLISVVQTSDEFYYIDGLTAPHYYGARSVDMTGNKSPLVKIGPSTPTNSTTPAQVSGVACSGDSGGNRAPIDNVVAVNWAPVTSNTTNLSCDETPYPIRDLKGYRVYKGDTAGFDPNNPSEVLAEWDPNTIPKTVNTITDTDVVNCRPYYYKVLGEDECSLAGAISVEADGSSTTSVLPAAPQSVLATDMGLNIHTVTWNAVTEDSGSPPTTILIDEYSVYRSVVNFGDDPNQASYSQVFSGAVSNPSSPAFQDPNVPAAGAGQSYYYKISALDDCPNESALSLPAEAYQCSFGGSIYMNINPGGSQLAGNQTIDIYVSGPVVQMTRLVIIDTTTGGVVYNQTDATAPYNYTWNASSVPAGRDYKVVALVTNIDGCTDSVDTLVATVNVVACCISSISPELRPTTGKVKNNEVFFDIINNCGTDVLIGAMDISFTNNAGQGSELDEVEYNIFGSFSRNRVIDLSPTAPSITSLDFMVSPLAPPLDLMVANDNLNPVRLRYRFTESMLNKSGSIFIGESITTRFRYTIPTLAGLGQCVMDVVTNPLSVVSCDPASDPTCK